MSVAGRHAAEAGRRTVRRGRRSGPQPGQGVSRGGMAALRPGNGNAGQAGRPAVRRDRDAGDTEAPRRRVEEPEPGDAVMREVVEVAGKDPGAGLRVRAAEAFAASEGGYGYRRVKAMLRTRVSEKVLRSPMP